MNWPGRFLDAHGSSRVMKSISYTPLTPWQVELFRAYLPHIGVWLTLLQDAADMAREQRRPITWGAVIKAYCLSQADAEIAV